MNQMMTKRSVGALLGGSLLVVAGISSAADALNCASLLPAFQDACIINNDLASGGGSGGNYIGSCAGGGRCDNSVYNKLSSASNKVGAGKVVPDACNNLASIQSDLDSWVYESKPKIDQIGYTSLSGAITTLRRNYQCP